MKKALLILFSLSAQAWAFPEMTRHGYTQCTACHLSPSGGGVLTAYGRQMSEEVLSAWGYKGEGQVLHGALKADPAEKGILAGGDVRSAQIHRKNSSVRTGRFFLMQANLDLAYQYDRYAAMISVGQIEEPLSGRVQGNLNATRFYGMVNLTEAWALRAGRFMPAFGLNMPDHVLVTKQGLGLQPWMQYDTAETSLLTENWSLFAGVSKTVDNTPKIFAENAVNLHGTYNFGERFKAGASGWYGENDANIRRLYGVNAILGFTHHLYNLTEVDFSRDSLRNGMFAMSRLGYEVRKGIIPYVQYQHQHADLEDRGTVTRYYTLGGHFFPRPHFEVSGQWSKVRNAREWSDDAYLLVHYYF
jgi:hypothetical protein